MSRRPGQIRFDFAPGAVHPVAVGDDGAAAARRMRRYIDRYAAERDRLRMLRFHGIGRLPPHLIPRRNMVEAAMRVIKSEAEAEYGEQAWNEAWEQYLHEHPTGGRRRWRSSKRRTRRRRRKTRTHKRKHKKRRRTRHRRR